MAEHTLESIAFPILDEAQIAQAASCTTAEPRRCEDGETLIAIRDREVKFFIVNAGEVEIIDYSGDAPKTASPPCSMKNIYGEGLRARIWR